MKIVIKLFTFMHLADVFIQSDLVHSDYTLFYEYVYSLGIEPTTFCAANAMLYHWATGKQMMVVLIIWFMYLTGVCVCWTVGYAQPHKRPSSGASYRHANRPVFRERKWDTFIITIQRFDVSSIIFFMLMLFFAHQRCIYLINYTVKTVILWNTSFKITVLI